MTDAKVPDNKSDWKSIDIFLFSNGQQSSPPRKYHLATDQLDWWKATLNFLAESQYGSLHSMIDLYTIEGDKVETPMQLSHNTAYVAVIPTDIFIDAGYEKYLLKATRSWEKGQIRRSSNTAVTRTEDPLLTNINSDINNTKEIRDGSVTLKTIVASMVDNQASVIVKPETAADKHINNATKINPIKTPDILSRSSIQRPVIMQKNRIPPSPPRSRKPSLKRKDSVKIVTEMRDRSLSGGSTQGQLNKTPVRSKVYKPIQKQKDSPPETVLSKVEEIVNDLMSSSSLKEVNDKVSANKTSKIESISREKEAVEVSNIYKNAIRDKSSIVMDPGSCLSNNVNRQGGVHELFDENRQSFNKSEKSEIDKVIEIKEVFETGMTHFITKNNMEYPPLNELGLSSPIGSKMTKPENNVAVINKEGTVNLKLNIEIWSTNNEAKITPNTVSKKHSLIIPTQEKGSQVDIEAKALEHLEQNKPIHEIIASEMSGNEGNHTVIIVKCTCPNQGGDETKNNINPVNIGNNNFLVLLPVIKFDEDFKRCNCNENKRKSSSVENPVKKTTSCLSLFKEKGEKIFSYSEITSRINSSEVNVEVNTIHDKSETTSVKRKSVAIKEDQVMLPHMEKPKAHVNETAEHQKVFVLLEPNKSELVMTQKESLGSILHKPSNKFTQTEWCDVLLEVKLQRDGHYSFHMPTLEMLKNYKL